MSDDDEFSLRMKGYSLVTVNVLYQMPDYRNLVQEFVWQTLDLSPRYPRVERFLDYWRTEIDAIIKEVKLSDSKAHFNPSRFARVTQIFPLH
jgi:uncharacterized protein Usg